MQVLMRCETEGFVWKLADSCRQYALQEVETYVQG